MKKKANSRYQKKSSNEKKGLTEKRRRARRVWSHGRFGFNLPATLMSCSVHARRRAFEEGFERTSTLTKKLLRAALGFKREIDREVRLRPGEFTQVVRDLCAGCYGQAEIFETHLARAKAMWLQIAAEADRDKTDAQRAGYWSRLATRIRQVCSQACAAVAAHPVINGNLRRVDDYIKRQQSVLSTLAGSDDIKEEEFCWQSQARYNRITRELLRGHELSKDLNSRLLRLAFGFATESEAQKLALFVGKMVASKSTSPDTAGNDANAVIREMVRTMVVEAQTAACILEEHSAASKTVAELNLLCQALENSVIAISRLEQIVMGWATRWHEACAAGGDTASIWSGKWLNSTPEKVLESAMKLIAGPYVYGTTRQSASMESNDKVNVKTALESAVPSADRRRVSDGEPVSKHVTEQLARSTTFVEELSGELRTEFDSFLQESLLRAYPALAPFVATADGGVRFEPGRIIEAKVIRQAAARLATQSHVSLKVHAKTRFKALVRAAIASLQTSTGWGGRRIGEELARKMRLFCKNKNSRRRLEEHVFHLVRWNASKPYVDWCENHKSKIDDKPKKKLFDECSELGIDIALVVSAVTTQIKSLPGVGKFTKANWEELVSVVSRGKFIKGTDKACDFDVISCLTAGIKSFVDGVRDTLVKECGRAPGRPGTSLTDERAVRRIAIDIAMQDAWVATFARSVRDNNEIKRVLEKNERKVLKRAVRCLVHEEVVCELNLVKKTASFANRMDGDDFIESLQNKLVRFCTAVGTNVVYKRTAEASNKVLEALKDGDFATVIKKEVRSAMDRAALALANIDELTTAALKARAARVREIASRRPSSAAAADALDDDDDDRVVDAVDNLKLSSRERSIVLKAMARGVSVEFALIVERAGDPPEGGGAEQGAGPGGPALGPGGPSATDTVMDEGASTTTATPVTPETLVAASSAVDGATEDPVVRYWLPPKVGGACSPVCNPDFHTRAQNICSYDIASMAYSFDVVLRRSVLFPKGGVHNDCVTSVHGQRLLRAICDPRRNGLCKTPPTSSGSFNMGVASVSYLYEDEVDAKKERARTRARAPVLSTDAKASDVVFVGIDPGRNKTITACIVSPTTQAQTHKALFFSISGRELHASNAPSQRAKVNAQRRDEAEKKAVREGTARANEISLGKAAYAPNQEKVRAAVIRDQAYERAAKKFIAAVHAHYLKSMDETDTSKWPTVIVSCGDKGVAPGQRWGASPMKGAPSSSVVRLLQKISELYTKGRYEFEVVSEMFTSKRCPACDGTLSNFHVDRMLFPSEGDRFEKPNVRNGRVCANPECSWVKKCVNRDHVGAVNMLRVLARVLADEIKHSRSDKPPKGLRIDAGKYAHELDLLENALRGAFAVRNTQLRPPKEKVRTDTGTATEADVDSDADSDDEVTNRLADVFTNLTVAEERSSSKDAVAGAEALHAIATVTKDRRRGRAQFSGSSPEQNAQIRRRVQDKTPTTRRLEFTPSSPS